MTTLDSTTISLDSTIVTLDGGTSVLTPYPTLPYPPDNALELDKEPKVRVAQYGDGYEQRLAAGINNDLQKWAVTYDMKNAATAEGAFAFFESLGGEFAFQWTPPGEATPRRFVARKYKRVLPYGARVVQSVTTTFEEVMA